jgi:hypothetical protein
MYLSQPFTDAGNRRLMFSNKLFLRINRICITDEIRFNSDGYGDIIALYKIKGMLTIITYILSVFQCTVHLTVFVSEFIDDAVRAQVHINLLQDDCSALMDNTRSTDIDKD